jgi:hypothetical protein
MGAKAKSITITRAKTFLGIFFIKTFLSKKEISRI